MSLPLAISSTDATFWLALVVLLAAVALAVIAAKMDGEGSKQLFVVVGILIGLFGAGGLGSLFANKVADEAADKAAPQAANAAANKISKQLEGDEVPSVEGEGGSPTP